LPILIGFDRARRAARDAIGWIFGAKKGPRVPKHTAFVMLDYCGGEETDRLFDQVSLWNPGALLMLLDNGSPNHPAARATHRNTENSYVGGGIRDAITLAEATGSAYLFFCVSDLQFLDQLVIADFEAMMDADEGIAIVSCSLTPDTDQAAHFPWMTQREAGAVRQVRHADIICCLLRLSFIRSFGGFPPSVGGWGYDAEMAFHAKRAGKRILVSDRCAVRHVRVRHQVRLPDGRVIDKNEEEQRIYGARYGSRDLLRQTLKQGFCDEEADTGIASGAI